MLCLAPLLCFTHKNRHTSVDPYYFSNVFLEKEKKTLHNAQEKKQSVMLLMNAMAALCIFHIHYFFLKKCYYNNLTLLHYFITWN